MPDSIFIRRLAPIAALLALAAATRPSAADPPVHVTYLWHLEQPIYWPAPDIDGRRYETAWASIQSRWGGAAHPQNDLEQIFGTDDRVAVYQWRVRDAIGGLLDLADAGAQVSYSGGLIDNVASLGAAGQLGYGDDWSAPLREARGWRTSGGHPRVDLVQFPYHHALLPLLDPEVLRMELLLYRHAYGEIWGNDDVSSGLFPSEMAFAEHTIPVLADAGIDWVVVSNSHLSRACQDYPWEPGSGGDNIPPPNRADIQNPAQGTYNRISIDRGVAPANAVPFAYRPHWARFVDPETSEASRVVVVPAAMSESWRDGYACFGVGDVDALAPHNDSARPILLVLAHDGDNAFGGGYSYYHECTPTFAHAAQGAGHHMTTIAQYLADYPPADGDVVHVESGAWVNADGDFGSPSFLNWNWPLVDRSGQVDIPAGWAEDERNWAVITAATQVVRHATALLGQPDLAEVWRPGPNADDLDIAWHFLLGALNSGYMYYGASLDMELKPSVACNEAVRRAQAAIGGRTEDPLGPTIWLPQRYPDNPGGTNFGSLYGYREISATPAFWVWTFVHDVSGVDDVTLWVREDADGWDPLDDDANQTFEGGPGVGGWVAVPMTRREFPVGNVFDLPDIDDSILPSVIADEYYAEVGAYTDLLLDYFVEAVDTQGNPSRSPIQHVYIGSDGGSGDPAGVHWLPEHPARADAVTVYSPDPGWLHWAVNGWQLAEASLWPTGTEPFGDGVSVETPLAGPDEDGWFTVELGPFSEGSEVDGIDFVIRRSDGSWDNNGGNDYRIAIGEAVGDPPRSDDSAAADAGDRSSDDRAADPGSAAAEADGGDATRDAGGESVATTGSEGRVEGSDRGGGGASGDRSAVGPESPSGAGSLAPTVGEGCGCGSLYGASSEGGSSQALALALLSMRLAVGRRRARPTGSAVASRPSIRT